MKHLISEVSFSALSCKHQQDSAVKVQFPLIYLLHSATELICLSFLCLIKFLFSSNGSLQILHLIVCFISTRLGCFNVKTNCFILKNLKKSFSIKNDFFRQKKGFDEDKKFGKKIVGQKEFSIKKKLVEKNIGVKKCW